MGPGATTPGIADPKPQRRTHRDAPPPPGLLGAPSVIQGVRTGRALRAIDNLRRPPSTKRLGPCSRSPAHSPQPAPPLAPQVGTRPAGLLGANPNPRSAPKWHIPWGLALQRWGLGTPEPQCWTHPAALLPPGLLEAPLVIQHGRTGRALRGPGEISRPPTPKRLGPRS